MKKGPRAKKLAHVQRPFWGFFRLLEITHFLEVDDIDDLRAITDSLSIIYLIKRKCTYYEIDISR